MTSGLRNASSRRRSATVSNLKTRFLKIWPSGMNVIRVPVFPFSAFPVTLAAATGSPRLYFWNQTFPSR